VDKVRVGFIGAGQFISLTHLPTARASKRMEVRAIADLDDATLARHRQAGPVGYTTTDYKKLLADDEIDLIVIGTKQDLHARFTVEALDAGKWVLCEKPLCETDEEARRVLAAEARNPGRLAVGFNRRFAPAYQDAKRLFADIPRPWFLHYRLMYPSGHTRPSDGFYVHRPRILYEGTHILDLVCWLLAAAPARVYMTGDVTANNACLLEFADGSQVTFTCGSMGTHCLWKEYLELFGTWAAVTVSDFTDVRVRGIPGEFDRLVPPFRGEQAEAVLRHGFDFYETYKVNVVDKAHAGGGARAGMAFEEVRRPAAAPFDVSEYAPSDPDAPVFIPDKGWAASLEHFARCLRTGQPPDNADGAAGARATRLALALLASREQGRPVAFPPAGPA